MLYKRIILTIMAVIAALLLTACGVSGESDIDDSSPEGLETWGIQPDPSAQPSMGQVNDSEWQDMAQTSPVPGETVEGNTGTGNGNGTGGGTGTGGNGGGTGTVSPKPSTKPSTRPSTPSASPSSGPSISPPVGVSTASPEEAEKYVGKQLSDFISALGYSSRSDYEFVDEDDPSKGEIGTHYFPNGYTVTTLRNSDGETITAVTRTSSGTGTPALDP